MQAMKSSGKNPSRKAAITTVFFTVFLDLVGFGIILPLSPFLAREFAATALDIGLLMSIYSLMQFLFSPVWGRISDRFGRRPILLMSLFGAGLSYLAFAFATSLWMLFVARAFAGIFSATISTAQAYIADVTESEDRSKGMGLIGAALGLGFIFGPLIGAGLGHLGEQLGQTPPFGNQFAAIGAAALCLLNGTVAIFVLKESNRQLSTAPRESRWQLLRKYWQRPQLLPLIAVFFLSSFAMALMEVMLFPYVQDHLGWSFATASLGFAYVGLVLVFTQGFLIRRLVKKVEERRLLLVGVTAMSLSFFLIPVGAGVALLAVAMTILALGNGVSRPTNLGLISVFTSSEEQGEVMGVSQSLSALGRILGPPLGGWLYGSLSPSSPFLFSGVLALIGSVVLIRIFGRLRAT